MRFDGKTAIITGGAQGIGSVTAHAFASEGANVVIFDQNEKKMAKLQDTIEETGGKVSYYNCDITKKNEVENCMDDVNSRLGSIDILVNNAGITRDNSLSKMSDDDWSRVINTNLTGSFICSREAQKYMVRSGYGKIVMLSSISALGKKDQVNYASAKAGIQGMTKTMAIELGPLGINVNGVAPGFIETEMTKKIASDRGITYEELKESWIKSISIKRIGKPQDVANLILFLSSDQASYITGQTIYVAGDVTV